MPCNNINFVLLFGYFPNPKESLMDNGQLCSSALHTYKPKETALPIAGGGIGHSKV